MTGHGQNKFNYDSPGLADLLATLCHLKRGGGAEREGSGEHLLQEVCRVDRHEQSHKAERDSDCCCPNSKVSDQLCCANLHYTVKQSTQ